MSHPADIIHFGQPSCISNFMPDIFPPRVKLQKEMRMLKELHLIVSLRDRKSVDIINTQRMRGRFLVASSFRTYWNR